MIWFKLDQKYLGWFELNPNFYNLIYINLKSNPCPPLIELLAITWWSFGCGKSSTVTSGVDFVFFFVIYIFLIKIEGNFEILKVKTGNLRNESIISTFFFLKPIFMWISHNLFRFPPTKCKVNTIKYNDFDSLI